MYSMSYSICLAIIKKRLKITKKPQKKGTLYTVRRF
ncbi:hypothetical protein TSAR_010103 [Trichomalopsis sarcophagae]|uniref:Uncharacterized protein n=1 Tax=Trichomalopsis sarcophagae TaxID=543379 RepID=A0A232FG51_9HYME|nr:hypothetical protein TSAR_010103 [Trichomalopsis sarcophagae]